MKTVTSILLTLALLFGGIALLQGSNQDRQSGGGGISNVSVDQGTQTVAITAKGGYSPRNTTVAANMPTIIKVTTRGTYDCSSALTIPTIGYSVNLPASGTTAIQVPAQPPGTVLKGTCLMGMYSFSLRFE